MKKKHSGILTKLLLLAIIIYAATSLITMGGKIKEASDRKTEIEAKVEDLRRENEKLENDIKNSDSDAVIESIARGELGLTYPGERVFSGE